MPTEAIFTIAAAMILMVGVVTFIIVWTVRLNKRFYFQYHNHEIIVRISLRGLALYVDGNVEDEFMAQNVRLVTLRAFVEGEEVKVRIRIGLRTEVSASVGNNELPLISIGK